MSDYEITVFTPTYNRGYIIENLYESLRRQTYKNFEWVIIDDGSNDNTKDLFDKWINENNEFDIVYKKVVNGGKHRAINRALTYSKGRLFFIVDSDDYLTDDALEKILKWESTIRDKGNFIGVAGLKGYNKNKNIGKTFTGTYLDASSLEREENNIFGDKAEVFYTNILRQYKFPEFEGENFITENVVWNKIAFDGYKFRWFNEIIYIADYLEDGLTCAGREIFIKNPKGYAFSIQSDIKYYNKTFKSRVYMWLEYYLNTKEKITKKEMAINLNINNILFNTIILVWNLKQYFRR